MKLDENRGHIWGKNSASTSDPSLLCRIVQSSASVLSQLFFSPFCLGEKREKASWKCFLLYILHLGNESLNSLKPVGAVIMEMYSLICNSQSISFLVCFRRRPNNCIFFVVYEAVTNTSFHHIYFLNFPSFSLSTASLFSFSSVTFLLVFGLVMCFSKKNGSYNHGYHLWCTSERLSDLKPFS